MKNATGHSGGNAPGAGSGVSAERRHRRIGLAVTVLLLALTAAWWVIRYRHEPPLPSAPAWARVFIERHQEAEARHALSYDLAGARR